MAYDTMFQQQVAGNPEVDWNPTLYAVTFLAQSGSGRKCVLCMESDYSKEDCALVKVKVGSLIPKTSSRRDTQSNKAELKPKVVRLRGSQGWSVLPGIKGNAPSSTVGTNTPASCVGVNTVLFTAHAWGTDWESWRKQGHESQSRDPQGRDPQGRQLAH